MRTLPRSLDDIRGLRAARWVRESTSEQYDRFGPASQREQQDRFIERHDLVDTGLVFQVAHSGTTVWKSSVMNDMIASAKAGDFDLLLRGLLRPLAAQRPTHPRGAGGPAAPGRCRARDVRPAHPLLGPP